MTKGYDSDLMDDFDKYRLKEEKEGFAAQAMEASITIYSSMSNNVDFIKWIGSPEARIWFKMAGHVVRVGWSSRLHKEIYERFHKRGILVSTISQKEIAAFLGHKRCGSVSKTIKSMLDKGIIKEHVLDWEGEGKIVYELGRHDMGVYKHETWHAFGYFRDIVDESGGDNG